MNQKKWGLVALVAVLLVFYNGAQPDLIAMRTNDHFYPGTHIKEQYGPSLEWLDRLMRGREDEKNHRVKLDFTVLSSMMVAGLASGFKSQVANLLWMKSDEYWHEGMATRQVPLMEAVVTLDPEFIDAWSTAGWHWAYNIYADDQTDPKLKANPKAQRKKMDYDVDTGLDYLKRGSEMNPDKYRLYFEHGWTLGEKKGVYNEETAELYRIARSKPDARTIIRQVQGPGGKMIDKPEQGMDIVGRTIGHLYEKMPDFDKALDQYGSDLLQATPQQRALLDAVGEYWHRYGPDYAMIGDAYKKGDPTVKAQIKAMVPDVERLIQADDMRHIMENKRNGEGGQPTGAYITISARYIPSWKLLKQGKTQEAIDTMIGIMNGDPRYHMQGLPVIAKLLAMRGDAPEAIKAQLDDYRTREAHSAQDIGLHFLAVLFEKAAAQATDPKKKMAFNKLAYESWYRARERSSLDFYARRNTIVYEDKYGFTPPQNVIKQVKASRIKGEVNAAPTLPEYHQEETAAE
ncbi:MAG: hypothetical protein JO316_00670 [Abitibacteriaceae bacterium]|nr:hypothetical protein [Abditibacteriaceae bacterium]MBV9863840.1 hypothetical protein [Abditibacteriaceae bacterium]